MIDFTEQIYLMNDIEHHVVSIDELPPYERYPMDKTIRSKTGKQLLLVFNIVSIFIIYSIIQTSTDIYSILFAWSLYSINEIVYAIGKIGRFRGRACSVEAFLLCGRLVICISMMAITWQLLHWKRSLWTYEPFEFDSIL